MASQAAPPKTAPGTATTEAAVPKWTFLSNHTHVLFCLASWPGIRMRDVALRVGITERAVQRIVSELETAGYLLRQKVGRQNEYVLHTGLALRHPLEQHVEIGAILNLLVALESKHNAVSDAPLTKPTSKATPARRAKQRTSSANSGS